MAAYRKRMIGYIALLGVMIHAYALISHQMRMFSEAPSPATALGASSPDAEIADAEVTRHILALSVMCRASATSTASHDSGSDVPSDGSHDDVTTCPICAGIAIASPLPSPSALMIERLASAIVFEPTAHIAVGDLLRDALPPPRGPPSLV